MIALVRVARAALHGSPHVGEAIRASDGYEIEAIALGPMPGVSVKARKDKRRWFIPMSNIYEIEIGDPPKVEEGPQKRR